ncbi:hypothetical protein AL527_09640 [Pseudomonas fulva]|uniref:hypothetical protein n=1 Tax=Pseudomonas fulva TaxID=47880 RepID=UPI000CE98D2F|nr:hypothetical protein [Pseudomonas fulva]AVF55404.1 hypothetical protein AL527_09640 [Pseudomonas fulva]
MRQCGHEEPLPAFDIASDLRDYMLAFPQTPVPQPHPDPIAWMVGTAFWWTIEEAERDAASTGLPIVPVGPLSGGVEAEQLREVIKHSDAQIMRQSMRISNQRAQLAEAHGLLRLIAEQPMLNGVHRARIKTLLSASPKPQVKS